MENTHRNKKVNRERQLLTRAAAAPGVSAGAGCPSCPRRRQIIYERKGTEMALSEVPMFQHKLACTGQLIQL